MNVDPAHAAPMQVAIAQRDLIWLLYAYPKNLAADLTPIQVSQLAIAVKEELGDEKADV